LLGRVAELQERALEAGRGRIPVTLLGAPTDPAKLERFFEAGIHRFVWWLPAEARDEVEPKLDEYAQIAGHVGVTR
jgi:hypothetical protein